MEAKERAARNSKPGAHFYGVKLVHISWPDADDLLSNALEFDNEVEGPWPLQGCRAMILQIRPTTSPIQAEYAFHIYIYIQFFVKIQPPADTGPTYRP